MSRIGKVPIKIPEGVTVKLEDRQVMVEGPRGKLIQSVRPEIKIEIKKDQVVVTRKRESRVARSLHGLVRTLIANMIKGVTQGFSKTLEIHGTGYRANQEGKKLILELGFSHPVEIEAPEGIEFQVKEEKEIKVAGIDKQQVGNVAASIRKIRKPEPYKGKGIRYQGEVVRRKPGKAAKIGAGEAKYE